MQGGSSFGTGSGTEAVAAPVCCSQSPRQQLGEFLYRVARVTKKWESEVPTPSGPINLTFAASIRPARIVRIGVLYP